MTCVLTLLQLLLFDPIPLSERLLNYYRLEQRLDHQRLRLERHLGLEQRLEHLHVVAPQGVVMPYLVQEKIEKTQDARGELLLLKGLLQGVLGMLLLKGLLQGVLGMLLRKGVLALLLLNGLLGMLLDGVVAAQGVSLEAHWNRVGEKIEETQNARGELLLRLRMLRMLRMLLGMLLLKGLQEGVLGLLFLKRGLE